ncbi:adenosylcobinamide-GDP ribazoletransferase [Nonomuraea sp. NPDC049309]|uniref:adenosylcobinamide-GDP ribazoletransferase n=1 Tax=Nonomuraea sp. NPDC049309 TaxID=3364350 RepID=UPI00371EA1C9
MRSMDGLRFAVGTLSVFPVHVERVDRRVAGRAMALAPVVGLVLGLVASLPLVLLNGRPLLAAALAIALLALLTRALHLDGLADLADGLGSAKPAAQALDIMKKSDIGPFGVVSLVLTLLVQVAALSSATRPTAGVLTPCAALVTACLAGRLALTWACREGVPAARPEGLGALVAGTVRRPAAVLATLAALLVTAAIGWLATVSQMALPRLFGSFWIFAPVAAPVALLAGLGAALLLLGRARRRLGGITGDVLGALVETATTAALVAFALLA